MALAGATGNCPYCSPTPPRSASKSPAGQDLFPACSFLLTGCLAQDWVIGVMEGGELDSKETDSRLRSTKLGKGQPTGPWGLVNI